jgi:PAS domain S-box-containing protein
MSAMMLQQKEIARLEALSRYAVLDTLPEKALDELTALAGQICGTPVAMIAFVDEHREWLKSSVGMESIETPREVAWSVHALRGPELLIVPNAEEDSRFSQNPMVAGEPGVRFFAAAPLLSKDGHALGALCVMDRVPRALTPKQEQALRVLADQVMTHLELQRKTRELAARERSLRASEGKLRAVFEAAPDCVKLLAPDGTLLGINAAGLRLIEADRCEGQNMLAIVVPEDRAAVRAAMEAVADGEKRGMQLRIAGMRSGTLRWIETSMGPFRDEMSGQDLLVGVSHDITARKIAEEKFQRLNRLYAVASEINQAIVRLRDPQELYERACRIAVEQGGMIMAWVGLVDGEMLKPVARWGRHEGYLDVLRLTVKAGEPEGNGPAGTAFRSGRPAYCNDIAAASTFFFREEAGQRGYRSCAVFPLQQEGHSVGVLAVYVGETGYFDTEELHLLSALAENLSFAVEAHERERQRRQAESALSSSEERFRQLAENINEVFWIRDLSTGQVLYVSPAYAEIWGHPCESLYQANYSWMDSVHPEDRQRVRTVPLPTRIGDSYDVSYRIVRPDGTERWIRARAFPVQSATGEIYRLAGVAEDITQHQRTKEALEQSQERLAAATDAGRIGIWEADLATGRTVWSKVHEELWGLAPGEFQGDLDEFHRRVHPDDRAMFGAALDEAVGGRREFHLEYRIVRPDGSVHWIEGRAAARLDAANRPVRISGVAVDITARKRAEEESRDLAQRLVSTLESLNEGFYTLDPDWRVTYVNAEAERMAGRSRAELLGKNIWTEFPEIVGTITQREFERAMRERVAVHFEMHSPPLGVRFENRAYPAAHGLAVYTRDITHEHQSRDALRISEERFRLLSKATNDAIWDWDLVSGAHWWNEGLHALFGYYPANVAPTSGWWEERVHPDDRARAVQNINQVIDGGHPAWSDEYRFLCEDGSYAHVLDRGYVIRDSTGIPVRMIGCMTDLTERMRSKERIAQQAALLDKARDAILVRDLDHRITFWNKSAERLYGWKADEVLGRSVRELLYEDPTPFDEAMDKVAKHGEWGGDLIQVSKDGRKLTIECRWTLVRDESGEPRSVLAIDTDVTERKKLEQQFFRAQRMESIGTLAGGIAHDLNNALSPIILSLDLLRMRFTDPGSAELLAMIAESADRGAEMVRQVLSFARGVEGLRVEVVVPGLIRGIAKIVNDTFLKHIQVRTIVPADVWTLLGDPTQLHQVLLNLCVNGRDAMPKGGMLTISAENLAINTESAKIHIDARPGPHVLLRVQDTGTGMAPEILEQIFDPFFTTKEVGRGTGLGLSTSLALVKSHGGFICVASELGKGTTFEIYLPAQLARSPAPSPAAEAEMPRGHGELILVIDDEPIVREVTRQTLEAFGYRVIVACDGVEGITTFTRQEAAVSVVLTDITMPGLDGTATIHALRKINPAVPIVAVSGLSGKSHVAKINSVGVDQFLAKPYTTEALLQVLKALLGGRSAARTEVSGAKSEVPERPAGE